MLGGPLILVFRDDGADEHLLPGLLDHLAANPDHFLGRVAAALPVAAARLRCPSRCFRGKSRQFLPVAFDLLLHCFGVDAVAGPAALDAFVAFAQARSEATCRQKMGVFVSLGWSLLVEWKWGSRDGPHVE